MEKVVVDGSDMQVNIPHKIRVETIAEVRAQQVTKKTFVPAFDECYKLMSRDNFHRFVPQPQFTALLDGARRAE